jgi:hypothetical protein
VMGKNRDVFIAQRRIATIDDHNSIERNPIALAPVAS